MNDENKSFAQLLAAAESGDRDAQDKLFRPVEGELREIARRHMSQERPDHTLQPTVLVNEAFCRLVGRGVTGKDRTHFCRAAARAMRLILVDHERKRRAKRRGGGEWQRSPMDPDEVGGFQPSEDILGLNEALNKLALVDPCQSEIVELHHFAGYTFDETAQLLELSVGRVKREWDAAKAWLFREMKRGDDGS